MLVEKSSVMIIIVSFDFQQYMTHGDSFIVLLVGNYLKRKTPFDKNNLTVKRRLRTRPEIALIAEIVLS